MAFPPSSRGCGGAALTFFTPGSTKILSLALMMPWWGRGGKVETTRALPGKMLGMAMGEAGPHCLPQVACSSALGTVTARMLPSGVARGGCRAVGSFLGHFSGCL